jgi:hypothetical protein
MSARTFNETTGPNPSVIGEISTLGPGTDVAEAKLNPVGAQMAFVQIGFKPWLMACGHQLMYHMKSFGSAGAAAFPT